MPKHIYDTLSEHGKKVCRFIVAENDLATGYREDLGSGYGKKNKVDQKIA